jgi:hypothetical protein
MAEFERVVFRSGDQAAGGGVEDGGLVRRQESVCRFGRSARQYVQ